ncbi:MAG: hypothetical protein WD002_08300 [Pseudomonadales bacterium]
MSDNGMDKHNTDGTDPGDLRLARAIRDLDSQIQPTRNLWPGIERKIADYPQRRNLVWSREWMPYGVAASLLIALSALVISLIDVRSEGSEFVSYDRAIDNMQAEYVQVRNPMVQQFSETNRDLNPVVLEDLYKNIEIMEQARREIEDQVRKNPENRRLVEMLMRIHEQEMELLKQDYTQPSHSM